MYDRQTLSLWSQINGAAMAGDSMGRTLDAVPSTLTTWKSWKAEHPETLVLRKPPLEASPYASYHDQDWVGLPWYRSRDRRLKAKTLVLGIEPAGEAMAAAIELKRLAEAGVFAFDHGPSELLAVSPPEVGEVVLFRIPEELQGAVGWQLRLVKGRTAIVLPETSFVWDWRTGISNGGSQVPPLVRQAASPIYWGIWSRFHPDAELLTP